MSKKQKRPDSNQLAESGGVITVKNRRFENHLTIS